MAIDNGTFLGLDDAYLADSPTGHDQFSSEHLSVTASGIRSIDLMGGTASYPNSVYYDNITAEWQPPINPNQRFLEKYEDLETAVSTPPLSTEPPFFQIKRSGDDLFDDDGWVENFKELFLGTFSYDIYINGKPVFGTDIVPLETAAENSICFFVAEAGCEVVSKTFELGESRIFDVTPFDSFRSFNLQYSADLQLGVANSMSSQTDFPPLGVSSAATNDLDPTSLIGNEYFFTQPLFGDERAYGLLDITDVADAGSAWRLGFHVRGISRVSAVDVPEPPELVLMGVGLVLIGGGLAWRTGCHSAKVRLD